MIFRPMGHGWGTASQYLGSEAGHSAWSWARPRSVVRGGGPSVRFISVTLPCAHYHRARGAKAAAQHFDKGLWPLPIRRPRLAHRLTRCVQKSWVYHLGVGLLERGLRRDASTVVSVAGAFIAVSLVVTVACWPLLLLEGDAFAPPTWWQWTLGGVAELLWLSSLAAGWMVCKSSGKARTLADYAGLTMIVGVVGLIVYAFPASLWPIRRMSALRNPTSARPLSKSTM